jgi:hypothetical protein
MVTYLHHTSPKVPKYDTSSWTFVHGATTTIGRDFGIIGTHFFHNIQPRNTPLLLQDPALLRTGCDGRNYPAPWEAVSRRRRLRLWRFEGSVPEVSVGRGG